MDRWRGVRQRVTQTDKENLTGAKKMDQRQYKPMRRDSKKVGQGPQRMVKGVGSDGVLEIWVGGGVPHPLEREIDTKHYLFHISMGSEETYFRVNCEAPYRGLRRRK
eukprot:281899-Hanusia_phi.AAC.1